MDASNGVPANAYSPMVSEGLGLVPAKVTEVSLSALTNA